LLEIDISPDLTSQASTSKKYCSEKSSNHKQELPTVAMFVNGLGRYEHSF